MRITLRYFAVIREAIGRASENRDLPAGSTVRDLRDGLVADYPNLDRLMRAAAVMVNQEYVEAEHRLADGDEVALIPPVSGGAGPFEIVEQPIDLDTVVRLVADDESGAIVTFEGTVRNHARGREVRYLEYEAYPAAAERMLARIGEEIRERWGIDRIAIVHRVGRLEIGEVSVVIAVSSPHRAEAFDACRYAIERLKQVVPIWKKEFYSDGETWIGSEAEYQATFGRASMANS